MPLQKIITKILAYSLLSLAIIGLNSVLEAPVSLASYLPIEHEQVKDIYLEAGLPAPPAGENGEQDAIALLELIVMNALAYTKILVGVIGIAFIVIMGFRMVLDSDREETVTNTKKGMIYTLIAFALISMSQDIATILDFGQRSIIDSPQEILRRVGLFDRQVEIILTFIKYIIATFAVLMVVRSAVSLISAGGNEEDVTKHRKSILYSAGGLILIYVGEIFINKVFYIVDKNKYLAGDGIQIGINASEGVRQIIGITNFVVSFAGPVAVLMLIAGAVMYATAGGDDSRIEQAKRLILSVIIGIVILYGAFAFVSSIVAGQLEVANS